MKRIRCRQYASCRKTFFLLLIQFFLFIINTVSAVQSFIEFTIGCWNTFGFLAISESDRSDRNKMHFLRIKILQVRTTYKYWSLLEWTYFIKQLIPTAVRMTRNPLLYLSDLTEMLIVKVFCALAYKLKTVTGRNYHFDFYFLQQRNSEQCRPWWFLTDNQLNSNIKVTHLTATYWLYLKLQSSINLERDNL